MEDLEEKEKFRESRNNVLKLFMKKTSKCLELEVVGINIVLWPLWCAKPICLPSSSIFANDEKWEQ